MIHINLGELSLPHARRTAMEILTVELMAKAPAQRNAFIDQKRDATWAHSEVLAALRAAAGNKCWYSEVKLEGQDPNVDHFRPKGRIQEVDANLQKTGVESDGYWWLAFEFANYRLAAMHANQRRVDVDTQGGKWDFFPIRGNRAAEGTVHGAIVEDILALDPCSKTDIALMWFDPDGRPCGPQGKRKANDADKKRIDATIWLYHLDKTEIQTSRRQYVDGIYNDLRNANADFVLWARDSGSPNIQARNSFDQKLGDIRGKLADDAVFAGAKRCAVRIAMAQYEWINEFLSL